MFHRQSIDSPKQGRGNARPADISEFLSRFLLFVHSVRANHVYFLFSTHFFLSSPLSSIRRNHYGASLHRFPRRIVFSPCHHFFPLFVSPPPFPLRCARSFFFFSRSFTRSFENDTARREHKSIETEFNGCPRAAPFGNLLRQSWHRDPSPMCARRLPDLCAVETCKGNSCRG